ncbi:hypothetical protein [Gallaecimonas pentaromativorans]|uniref:hypothetical protein n=1 Tax=Gallaecimonas pentaromativorans TaxID=584787 RepID=UPI003A93C922
MKYSLLLLFGCLITFGARAEKDLALLLTQADHATAQADYPSARALLSQIPESALSQLPAPQQGHYLCLKAEMMARLDRDYSAALGIYQQGLTLLKENLPGPELLRCELVSFQVQAWAGLWPKAIDTALQAEQLAQLLGDKVSQAKALTARGFGYRSLHMDAQAEPVLMQAVALAKAAGDVDAEVKATADLIAVKRNLGQPYLELALQNNERAQGSKNVDIRAQAASTLANVQFKNQHYDEALDALLAVYKDVELHAGLGWQGTMASNLAEVYTALGDYHKARFYIDIALDKLAQAKLVRQRMAALLTAADLADKEGDWARRNTLLKSVVAAQATTDSPRQNELAAKALKQLAQVTTGDEQRRYWDRYAQLMDDRLKQSDAAKQEMERSLSLAKQPTPAPAPAPWRPSSLGLVLAGALLLVLALALALWRCKHKKRLALAQSAGIRRHSELPYSRQTLERLEQLLSQGLHCQVLYFRVGFARQPFYQGGFRAGNAMQQRIAARLRQLFPGALLIGEPDSFHYLVVLDAGRKMAPQAAFDVLDESLQALGGNGLQLTCLNFPNFPQISRVADVGPLCELLLLGLQLASETGPNAWVQLSPLPVAARAMEATDIRAALLAELKKGYIIVTAGGSALTSEPDWALLAESL